MDRAIACIKNFVGIARTYPTNHILPVCTACVRTAENSNDFLTRVYDATGVLPRVLSGEEEAQLSVRGVLSVLPESISRTHLLIIDIGGGSTELAYLKDNELWSTISISLGVVSLAERHLHHDPPHRDELDRLEHDIRSLLSTVPLLHAIPKERCTLAGTAGTITTLAAMALGMREYDPNVVNSYRLSLHEIENLWLTLTSLPRAERQKLPGLEPGRADVIIPGTAAVRELLYRVRADYLLVSDAGLLEGILLEHADKKRVIP